MSAILGQPPSLPSIGEGCLRLSLSKQSELPSIAQSSTVTFFNLHRRVIFASLSGRVSGYFLEGVALTYRHSIINLYQQIVLSLGNYPGITVTDNADNV